MSIPELADITTCIHCGQKFSYPRVQIIGDNQKLTVYLEALSKHLTEKHPKLGGEMISHGAAFMEMLFLRNFRTTDPELSEQQDRVRWQVHQQTLKARYPDENLKEQADNFVERIVALVDDNVEERVPDFIVDQLREMVAEAFTSIRDALEEPGKYPVVQKGAELITR